jgi:RNA recognition motif-containing protein
MNIYVGSLHFKMSEAELKEIFEEYGEVTSAKVIIDKYSGKSKGFGFVEMPNDAEAKKAIEELNGAEVSGRNIIVNESIERTDRKSNFRGGDNDRRGGGGGNRRVKGYGFLQTEDDKDIFIHRSGLEVSHTELEAGQAVEFEVEQREKGPVAIKVKRVD